MRSLVLCLASVVWLASCATPGIKGRGANVVQVSTPPSDCVLLGAVEGSDDSMDVNKPWEHTQIGPSKNAAIADALDQAAAKGATHASLREPRRESRGFSVAGMAYDCSARAAIPAPPTTSPDPTPAAALGCFKDTDCKGERICRNRECVDP